jgi:KDO2-lipid IV(A) lauroyltransferase
VSRLRQWAEAAGVGGAYLLASLLPRRARLALGAFLGAVAGRLDRRHTAIARDNLARAYGSDLKDRELLRILRACWRHFGRITLDALAFRRITADDVGRTLVFEGEDNARAAYALGRGVLVFSAHFGHWEAGAILFGKIGLPFAVITRPLDNPILETLLAHLRRETGNAVIHKRRAVRETMKALARGSGVAILIDQDAREDGVFVPFFGRPASTTPTLAMLALRTGAPVVPVFARVEPDGRIVVRVEPPVAIEPTSDRDADVLRVTAECTAVVERWVRRHPEQWLWMHRRWKTRPPAETDGARNA